MAAYKPNNKWHLDKRVSVGHLLTTAMVAAAMTGWFIKTESRLNELELRVASNSLKIYENLTRNNEQYAEIIRRLERLNDQNVAHLESHTPKVKQ